MLLWNAMRYYVLEKIGLLQPHMETLFFLWETEAEDDCFPPALWEKDRLKNLFSIPSQKILHSLVLCCVVLCCGVVWCFVLSLNFYGTAWVPGASVRCNYDHSTGVISAIRSTKQCIRSCFLMPFYYPTQTKGVEGVGLARSFMVGEMLVLGGALVSEGERPSDILFSSESTTGV